MGHNRNLADYAHHFDGTHIDLGSGNIETQGVLTYEDVTNVDAIGIVTARAGVKVPDNQRVFLGTGDDLQILHGGTNSAIENHTGTLFIDQHVNDGDINIRSDNSSGGVTNYILCDGSTGEVKIHHYGTEKLRTTTTGATVTGTLVSDSVTSELDLSAISASISDTAVDIFVYDTRKDSDGGAWRKRTSHTSWYNETLNTATRGSRKEFPAVAVIVAKGDDTITIYDGDDPDLPMWMVMPVLTGWDSTTKVSALNGIIVMTNHAYNGTMFHVKFIEDSYNLYDCRSSVSLNSYTSRISDRATVASYSGTLISNIRLAHADLNDVAMTVLPNAPIDDATGLPVPTIAVATDAGVSVIKDDGTVVDIRRTSDDDVHHVELDGDRVIMFMELGAIYVATIPSADQSGNPNSAWSVYGSYGGNTSGTDHPAIQAYGAGVDLVSMKDHTFATAGYNQSDNQYKGLSILSENLESSGNGMVAWIRSDCNTGYMHGDIKGAFLSDTDTTNAVATYSDGFSNNDKGWGFVNASITGGNLVITQQGSARATDGDALSHVSTGVRLVFTGTVSGSGTGTFIIDDDGAGAGQGATTTYGSVSSTGSFNFTATKTGSPRIRIMRTTGSNDYNINFLNITTEYDRSVNGKGLSVYGTVPKSAVATGADLVAYGSFGTTNYLKQPYNSDLAPGTGAYSVICWFKTGTSTSDQYIFDRASGSGSRNLLLIMHSAASGASANKLQWWHRDGSGNYTDIHITDKTVTDDIWHQVVALYDGSTYKVYVDGIASSITSSVGRNVGNDGSPPLYIGVRYSETAPMTGKLALFRYSKSAPSPEQIKKMYEDEKVLFQENAKATLYGSSDAVTALGYDEDTELLHVGTSAGRSDFQGLRRINNTTTAVTTAISASDELIAEQ